MKVVSTSYRVQTRAERGQKWSNTYYSLESLAAAKRQVKYLVKTLFWRILRHQESVTVVAKSPKKQRQRVVRQKKAKDCTQWPHCACILKGTVKTCVPTDGPLKRH
jgi:hypothetical protein